jgi:nitrous oxide reductase accessory protein NosL
MANTKKDNWYLAAMKGESGFRLAIAPTEEEARSFFTDEGCKITHFGQIPTTAGKAIAKMTHACVTRYSYEPK